MYTENKNFLYLQTKSDHCWIPWSDLTLVIYRFKNKTAKKKMRVPKEVYPLVGMIGTTLIYATAFMISSLFKPDVLINRQRRMAILK